jgi:3-O-methylgallate 3,4-dioxygenase
MARLVAAYGASHSIMLASTLEDWLTRFRESDPKIAFADKDGSRLSYDTLLARAPADADRYITPEAITGRWNNVQAALARLKDDIAAAKLDVLIIVGDDQNELFQMEHLPTIGIYHGETIRNVARPQKDPPNWREAARYRRLEDEADKDYPVHRPLALHLITGAIEREFDVSSAGGLKEGQYEGHAFSFIHRWFLKGTDMPIVPVFLNTYMLPNVALPRRCLKFGQAIGELVASFPEDMRVGILASGGLSHFVVDEEIDHIVMNALKQRDWPTLAAIRPERLRSGSSEILNWIVLAGALGDLSLKWMTYAPGYRTPALTGTGLCFASWS